MSLFDPYKHQDYVGSAHAYIASACKSKGRGVDFDEAQSALEQHEGEVFDLAVRYSALVAQFIADEAQDEAHAAMMRVNALDHLMALMRWVYEFNQDQQ